MVLIQAMHVPSLVTSKTCDHGCAFHLRFCTLIEATLSRFHHQSKSRKKGVDQGLSTIKNYVDRGLISTNQQVNGQTEGEEAAAAIEDSIRQAEEEVEKAEAAAVVAATADVTEEKQKQYEIEVRMSSAKMMVMMKNIVCL